MALRAPFSSLESLDLRECAPRTIRGRSRFHGWRLLLRLIAGTHAFRCRPTRTKAGGKAESFAHDERFSYLPEAVHHVTMIERLETLSNLGTRTQPVQHLERVAIFRIPSVAALVT